MNLPRIGVLLSICAPVLLVACGGGSSSGGSTGSSTVAPGASAEGVYNGTLSGNASAGNFQALVLENDEFWSIYGNDMGSVFYVYGFVQGSGLSNSGSFSANSVRDFGFSPAMSGKLTATYSATSKTMSGSVNYGVDGIVTFAGGPIAG